MEDLQEDITEEKIDYQAIFFKLFRRWYLFLITLIIAIISIYFYNKTATTIYQNNTTLKITTDNDMYKTSEDIRDGFGLFSNDQNIENEMVILKSYSLVNQTVKQLNLEVTYYDNNALWKSYEIYLNSPVKVQFDSTIAQPVYSRFNITILSDKTYQLDVDEQDVRLYNYSKESREGIIPVLKINKTFQFGQMVTYKDIRFTIVRDSLYFSPEQIDNQLYFNFNEYEALTAQYRARLAIAPINEDASILDISMSSDNAQKIVAFLNKLTQNYIDRNLNKKNQIATNTIHFIDEQLNIITDSLHIAENLLQDFRRSRKVMDLSFQAQRIFDKMQELENQRAVLLVNSKYYDYIKNYFEKNDDISDIAVPSSMGIKDPILNSLIMKLIDLNTKRKRILTYSTENSPPVKEIDSEIENTKDAIFENIRTLVNQSTISINDIDKRLTELTNQINKLPKTERELFGIERQFKLNDAIYTYMLQKRAEAQIAKASNLPDSEVIDKSRLSNTGVIKPQPKINYLISIFIGLVIPAVFVYFMDILNFRLIEKKDIEAITNKPILGFIAHKNEKQAVNIVAAERRSEVAENFRSIRTNLAFFADTKKEKTILVTSSLAKEGKSFNSINLSSILALSKKKVILLGFDLRKPSINKDLDKKNKSGISNIYKDKSTIEQAIQVVNVDEETSFDFIPSGPLPPNPSELIAGEKTNALFDELKKKYDYIVIDTPPVGVVSDALLLMKYSDINIYIVRQNRTPKKVFANVISNLDSNKIENITILMNDVKTVGRNKKYSYGYSYGYGYGYGYYNSDFEDDSDETNTGRRKKGGLFKRFRKK